MIKFLLFLPSLFFGLIAAAQDFQTVEFLRHYTKEELAQAAFFATTFEHGADAYKVTYLTDDLDGNTVTVSGLLALPEDLTKRYPLACYQHGTSGTKDNVPSRLELDASIAMSLAGKGFVTVAPDLLGLGDHDDVHPYVHAASAAWVATDMLRAVRVYAEQHNIFLNDQIFLTGYSQGGHSAMALHRHLEQMLSGEFQVTAAAPMSGPYSIAEVMNGLIVSGEEYTQPAYLINTFISYQRVYGNIYPDIATAFKAPYRQMVADFSNNDLSLADLNIALTDTLNKYEGASIPLRVLEDAYIQAVTTDPNHPMVVAMKENNVYDWAPIAPTRMYYCTADEQVPFENSTLALTTMTANGAADVQALNLSSFFNHFLCALPAAVEMVEFFQLFQMIEDGPSATGEVPKYGLDIFPNPTSGSFTLKHSPGDGWLYVIGMDGTTRWAQPIFQGDNVLVPNGLNRGLYTVKVVTDGLIRSQKLLIF